MRVNRGFLFLSLFGVFGVAVAGGQELVQETIPNWPAPATWTPTRAAGVHTLANITSPLPFIGVTPCRVADTRGNGFTGSYGPPSLVANATRSFTITGQCGIPASAEAVSFNFGALNVGGGGDLRVFPAGGSVPLVSTLNYGASTPNIANAAIVPLGTAGAITVQADAVSIDLIIDLNGYYAPAGVGAANTFLGHNAGNFAMTGDGNTAIGDGTLFHNTTGSSNTANGNGALSDNTTGFNNTANGRAALIQNTMGNNNTASGQDSLFDNTTGGFNTACGNGTLFSNVVGDDNTAIGASALANTTGSSNIGIGMSAGSNLTTGGNDICIGNSGVAAESGTIRVGSGQTATFIAGINGVNVGSASPVYINSSGQLGTAIVVSSRRFKQDIRDIADESDGLMRLRPVAFKYKPELDATGLTQYGLIAEEVVEVYPHLVGYDQDGQLRTVHYDLINALMLNEVQKQHRTVEAQEKTIEQQKAEIEGLKARMSRLEARLVAEPGP
jgi:Chaperone of endosialidase